MRNDPLIIGALGGSGTRVVARLAQAAGVFMGGWLNEAGDSEPMQKFYNSWLRSYLEQGGNLGGVDSTNASSEFRKALQRHRVGIEDPEGAWGVKVPRSILMLDFWQQHFPQFRFIHVLRNGLDMAYSSDHRQLGMVGDLILDNEEQAESPAARAMAYWCRVNTAATDFGVRHMGARYFRIRYEDLCADPTRIAREFAAFVNEGSADDVEGVAIRTVRRPNVRWRTKPAAEIARLIDIGGAVAERFGYQAAR